MSQQDYKLDSSIVYAGVDEAGRGCLFGPVVAAAVIIDTKTKIAGIRDSKKLTAQQRERLYEQIITKSQAYAIGKAEPNEIDKLNILQASLLAMQRAVMALPKEPEHLLIDGNFAPKTKYSATAIIKGDSLIDAISAASIIAKVTRDKQMIKECNNWPEYGLSDHKGYPTKQHIAALEKYGITPLHRKSFKPVKKIMLATTN